MSEFFEVTMAEAKARWTSHTKRVLNDKARKLASDLTQLDMVDGVPIVRLGMSCQQTLYFHRNVHGHVSASLDKQTQAD